MASLGTELALARDLDVGALADAIESIGFECTRCGACCTAGAEDPHTATVSPAEVRRLQATGEYDWRDVARPVPWGLDEDGAGETFEWALQTDACGDCTFYDDGLDGVGGCTVHADRPAVCATYPFSVALGGTDQPMGEAVDGEGVVRAHECEGLGREISRADAEAMAARLKARAIQDLEEAIAVSRRYRPADPDPGETVVHDSEGAKRPDGSSLDE